jgi:hypothetical protein
VHAGDQRLGGGDSSIGKQDILKFVIAGGKDGSALVDFRRIQEIEDLQMLDSQYAIHALKTEAALAIEEIGDVSLFETRLLRQTEAGEVAFINALPKSVAKIILQDSEFHSREYSTDYSNALIEKRFPQPVSYNDLDCGN